MHGTKPRQTVAEPATTVYDCHTLRPTYEEEPGMTQSSKHGRSLKMARAISRRKYKASQKRKNAAKYAARTGAQPAS